MPRNKNPDAFIKADHKALYSKDTILEISDDRHIRPFGAEEYPAQLQIDRHRRSDRKVRTMSKTDLVFKYLPRYHPLKDRTQHARLRIIKQLNAPEYDEAQTLLCAVEKQSADSDPPTRVLPKLVVAKVYDPMFYTGVGDVVADADMEFAHESTAYARFELALDKQKTPNSTLAPSFQLEFFGCWFFLATSQNPNFAGKTRPVRMILNEYMDGLSISEMCRVSQRGNLVPLDAHGQPISHSSALCKTDVHNTDANVASNQLSPWQRRMFIIDALVDGIARQAHTGVELVGAVHPDQIIVEGGFEAVAEASPYSPDPAARDANKPRVVVINYTRSIVGKCTAYGAGALEELPRPCSPIDRYDGRRLAALKGWWPTEWDNLPKPDRYDIWGVWFQRTFDTPDYIRRQEAEPLLDKINDKIFDVQEDEEAKLPAKYRSYSSPLDFLDETPEGADAFIQQCVLDRKEHEKIRAAARAELAKATPGGSNGAAAIIDKERQERLDKINDKTSSVQGDEETKLPSKYRNDEYEGPDFYHATPNGMRDFIDGCIRAQKERKRLLAVKRAERARQEAQPLQEDKEAKLPPHFSNGTFLHRIPGAIEALVESSLPATREREKIRAAERAELAKATAAFNKAEKERQKRVDMKRQEKLVKERRERLDQESFSRLHDPSAIQGQVMGATFWDSLDASRPARDVELLRTPPVQGTVDLGLRTSLPEGKLSHDKTASAEHRYKRSFDRDARGDHDEENRPADMTPVWSGKSSPVNLTLRTVSSGFTAPQVPPTASSPDPQVRPLSSTSPSTLQNLDNAVPRQPDVSRESRSRAQVGSNLRGRSQAAQVEDISHGWISIGHPPSRIP